MAVEIIHSSMSARINTRFFALEPRGTFRNPPPGTVVDHVITKKDWFDFLLVSQHVTQVRRTLLASF
jgi:hypothetical protein